MIILLAGCSYYFIFAFTIAFVASSGIRASGVGFRTQPCRVRSKSIGLKLVFSDGSNYQIWAMKMSRTVDGQRALENCERRRAKTGRAYRRGDERAIESTIKVR